MKSPQKKYREKRWNEILEMPKIPCACGCGTMIPPFTKMLKPAKYVQGHQARGNKFAQGRTPHNKLGDEPLARSEITRRYRVRRLKEIESLPKILCACGCGTPIAQFSTELKPAMYAHGHNPHGEETRFTKGQESWMKGRVGEQAPGWRGGTGTLPYGPGFTRKFKKILRERDNYTCQSCGIAQKEHGRILEIHHIDHNKMNNDPTNLITVCGKCNIWYSLHRDEPFVIMGRKR